MKWVDKLNEHMFAHLGFVILFICISAAAVPVVNVWQAGVSRQTSARASAQLSARVDNVSSQCADRFNTVVELKTKLEDCEAGVTTLEEELASVDVCAVSAVSMTFKEQRFLACMDSCLNDYMPKHAIVNDWMKHCWEQCIPVEGAKG